MKDAIGRALSSSKVLIFLVFAVAITVALKMGLVTQAWYQDTLQEAYLALMGGYSIVEVARAIAMKRVAPEAVLADPAAAMKVKRDPVVEYIEGGTK
jgi:hypothetical protein